MSYVELHCHSAFSFLEGASLPETLAAESARLNLPAIALLDRDGVYGSPRFHFAAQRNGIGAHIGAEVSVASQVRYPLLVKSRTGYQNLCRMITQMKLRAKKGEGTVTEKEAARYSEGLICLTGGDEGPLASALLEDGMAGGRRCLQTLIGLYAKDNVYVELQRHFDRREEARNQAAVTLAREFHLPLLATNGVVYATAEERELADVFTCLRHHCQLETAGRLLARNSARHLRSAEEMARLFADLPEALANTLELSSRLEFTLTDLGYQFPRYPVPPGETMMSVLRARTEEGARQRYRPYAARARRQIERELSLIEQLDLEGYFLIVWDLVRFCREQGILVQGRGSAANSAVCYCLGITAIDPIGMELLFERFLSEERGEWPDIDLDLPSGNQRERVIQYVYERYGKLGAAMTANVITYRGRSAAREMGKVLDFDEESIGRLSSLVGSWEWKDPKDTPERHFHQAGFDLHHPRVACFLDLCRRVQDLPRHLGQHSGGMVICQGQLDAVVPLEPATMPGRVVVQWDKEDCADLGLIKVDLLGLGMMAVLEDSLKLIRENYQETVDLAHLPPDDPTVYVTIQKADTVGMFQIESRAQMSSLPRNRPERFYDLVVQVALIRPGPIVGKMVHPYLKRRQGREAVTYPHPSVEPVLKRTLGVPLFQEQLLRMAMICANFTGGEAEELRRALGSKRSEQRMQEIEAKLRRGMTQNSLDEATQNEIVSFITSFARYGFPESHAASFAIIAYASAYLKCHYLPAFTAALLNNQPMGFYHPATLIKDAQRHGLKVKPVDVIVSDWPCTLEPDSSGGGHPFCLRLGLHQVRGLPEASAKALVRERQVRPFTCVEDLTLRVPELQKDELVMLAQIGALNPVGAQPVSENCPAEFSAQAPALIPSRHRRDALWQVERAVQPAGVLFEQIETEDIASPLEPMSLEERLAADFHGTGLSLGPHPMAYCRPQLPRSVKRAIDLKQLPHGSRVRVAGSVIVRQRPGTAKGFIFLSLEDETGIANVIIVPKLYEKTRLWVTEEKYLLVEGIIQNVDSVVHVKARTLQPLKVKGSSPPSRDFH